MNTPDLSKPLLNRERCYANDCKIQSIGQGVFWAITSHLWDSERTTEHDPKRTAEP
jgi:hypothetical protein